MSGKGDAERWHKRDNYTHIFRKEECECEECECKRYIDKQAEAAANRILKKIKESRDG